ncbi:MAG TPA: ribbon-helix-helix protein, CopG family [Microbacteriaceae bacterium]|jgi:predicted transcriptional regulator|nr:ribbon-helix-helix protein, CopG family [Microbacteriaceae bacterium]
MASDTETLERSATVKVTVNLPRDAVERIQKLASERGTTSTQILREALALKFYIDEQRAAGAKILTERDGSIRELVFTT